VINVYIGYDSRETVAYHVLAQSLIQRSSEPLAITAVGNEVLPHKLWWRPKGPHDSTEFSNARFAVPALAGYQGWAVFADCDMVCLGDLADLWAQRDDRYAVMCVQHDHNPSETKKFLGAEQTKYRRKNWTSLMLLNCGHPATRRLTAEYVNTAHGLDLHRFEWCSDDVIGAIHGAWNVLVAQGHQHPEPIDPYNIKLLHYTLGGPWHGYEPDGGHLWNAALRDLLVGRNPCADMVVYPAETGVLRFSGRYQRREP
jgi:hypothetical protein